MADQSAAGKALDRLRSAARNLAGDEEGLKRLGNEIALLATGMESLGRKPPSMKTSDFPNKGDEVDIPDESEAAGSIFERIIDENDLLPVWFLEQGALVQRSVARVVLTQPVSGLPPGEGWGTGFMVSPNIFMTNNHVIENEAFTRKIRIQFNFQLGPDGVDRVSESYNAAPDVFFHTSRPLDYTLVWLKPGPTAVSQDPPGAKWGTIPLNPNPIYREKQHFNVIQHPAGRRKEVALQNNLIQKLFRNVVHYTADTEPGSSGSPVLDNLWQMVALHHAGGERDPQTGKWLSNEGIRADAIVADLLKAFGSQEARKPVLAELGI